MKVPKKTEVTFSRREFELVIWCAALKKEDVNYFLKDSVIKRCKNIYMDYRDKEEEKRLEKEKKKEVEREKIMSEMDLDKELLMRRRYEQGLHTKRELPPMPQELKEGLADVPEIEGQEIPKELKEDEDLNKLIEEEFK